MNGKRAVGMAVLALVIWLAGATGTAHGQGNTWPGLGLSQMVEGAGWRLGPLRFNGAFTLSNAGYDTDVYYQYLGEDPAPDWTFAAGTPVQILLPLGKKIVVDITDSPQYLFYVDTVRERAWNNTLRGQIHFPLKRVYAQVGGGMADVRRRLSLELDINVREKRVGLDGLFLWQLSQATSIAFFYERAKYDYGNAEYMGELLADSLNREVDLVDTIAYVQSGRRTRLYLDGQYGNYAFMGGASEERDAKSYGIFGGVEFLPMVAGSRGRAGLRGGLKLGYMRLNLANPALTDGSGFAGEADVSLNLTHRTSVQAAFSRGFQFSIYSGATYYLSTLYRAGLSHNLSRRAALSYDASFGSSSYPDVGDFQNLGGDRYSAHTLSLIVRATRYLNMTLFGTLGRRVRPSADVTTRYRSFFGLNLVYGSLGNTMPSLIGEMVR
jgi:hypothetical protein